MTKKNGRKRSLALLLAILAAFALVAAACGDDDDDGGDAAAVDGDAATDDDGAATDGSGGESGFRIAIVAPSAENDVAFTQSIVDSVARLGETRDISVNITDGTFVVADAGAAIRGYAEEDYDLVIAHGSQYGAPLSEIAQEFPDVAFAWGTSADTFGLANVSAYTVQADQGGYVMGVMAAELSGGNIGIVGPVEVGDAKLYVDGFRAGALAQNEAVDVNVSYIDSFSDVALAQEAATAFVNNGADVLTGTAQMVVGATGVASTEGIPWFGTQSNQTSLGPDIVVASQVYKWEVVLEQIVADIENGSLGGSTYVLTLENGGLTIEYNDAFGLDPAIRTLGDETAAALAEGSLTTGVN